MICDNCKIDRLEKDFINNQKFCYICEYQKKLQISMENRTKKTFVCRLCKKEFTQIENAKRRQRDKYCSEECSKEGHQKQIDGYWTRKARRVDGV
jgi:hypothetical protein